MKFNALSGAVLAIPFAAAFPLDSPAWATSNEKRQLPFSPPPFDAASQLVSTSGQYAFVPPGPGDIRGECPGLNAMANHGYLPHNGVATIQQFISATNTVFGMAPDLGGFLANYGAIVDGNGLGWNILGVPHTGIGGSHGNYETDSSPLKSDLSQYGSNTRTIDSQFQTLYNMQSDPVNSNYNLTVLREFRNLRFKESIQKNPNFYYGPFSGIAVSQAAFTFIYRFMSNKSAAYPEGVLNKAVLKSFMSYSGPENNLTHTPGYERIPDQWYKRNKADEYSIPYFITDIGFFGEKYPEIYQPGCNNGTVNSFTPFSPATLTNGVYGSDTVQSKPLCFGTAFIKYQSGSFLGLSASQISALTTVLDMANTAMGGCPAATFNEATLKSCPGFSNYGGPSGPVAPGAIQS